MGGKLKMLASLCAVVLLFLYAMGCVTSLRDTVKPNPPGKESLTSDQGYHSKWDNDSVVPVEVVTPN